MEVLVQKIPSDVTENRLRLYFGNPKRGGPVEVRDFNSDKMEAVLFFKDDEGMFYCWGVYVLLNTFSIVTMNIVM